MPKLSKKQHNLPLMGHYVNNLRSAFVLLDDKGSIRELFRDLFTHTEYKMFAKRLEIARRLLSDQPYEQILQDLNVTRQTVASISNVLANRGAGYRTVHQKLNDLETRRARKLQKRQTFMERRSSLRLVPNSLLGKALAVGVASANSAIRRARKRRSADTKLELQGD